MGKPDLFAKRTFATQTESITGGAASWKDAPEMGVEHVQSDGILVIHDSVRLQELPAPWNLANCGRDRTDEIDEILLEFKMQGDHLDRATISRALVRRQVRETQRLEEASSRKTLWLGSQPLWMVSAYIPEWAKARYRLDELGRGCHQFLREDFAALWIASNELPLRDELIPFLITRTGRHLREFLAWVGQRKSLTWAKDLVSSLRMIPKDFLRDIYPTADEETKLNIKSWIFGFIEDDPSIEQEIAGRAIRATALDEARDAVKRNLRARKFEVLREHQARIDSCTNLDTLHRWLEGAVTAATVEEALGMD